MLEDRFMPANWRSFVFVAAAAAFGASLLFAQTARAEDPYNPNLSMQFDAAGDDLPLLVYDPAEFGSLLVDPDGTFHYNGSYSYAEHWGVTWNVSGNQDPFVTNFFTVTNNQSFTDMFTLTVLLPISPAISPNSITLGSIAGTVTDNNNNNAFVSAPTGGSIYTALIDASPVHTLMSDPFSEDAGGAMLTGTVGPASFGPTAGPAALSSIAVTVSFLLSPGDSASFTAFFSVEVPGPAGLPLIALFGLVGRRRRS
jgi:hypothetical protein